MFVVVVVISITSFEISEQTFRRFYGIFLENCLKAVLDLGMESEKRTLRLSQGTYMLKLF